MIGTNLTTMQVVKTLETKYKLDVSRELVFKYSKLGFITPEVKREPQPGFRGLGVQTWWAQNAVEKIFVVNELRKQNFKLPEIAKYYEMFTKGYLKLTDELEMAKYYRVVKYFLAAEAGINFNEHDILKLRFNLIAGEPEIDSEPVGAPSGRVTFIEGSSIFKSMKFRNGIYTAREEDKLLYS